MSIRKPIDRRRRAARRALYVETLEHRLAMTGLVHTIYAPADYTPDVGYPAEMAKGYFHAWEYNFPPEVVEQVVEKVLADASQRLGVAVGRESITVLVPRAWPNGAMGNPHAQVATANVVAGYQIVVHSGLRELDYRVGGLAQIAFCIESTDPNAFDANQPNVIVDRSPVAEEALPETALPEDVLPESTDSQLTAEQLTALYLALEAEQHTSGDGS